MANLIQVKRSLNVAAVPDLNAGELAYTANGDVLFIGHPDGTSANIRIGGELRPGVLTANQALVANSISFIDEIKLATATVGTAAYSISSIIDDDTFATGVSNTALATAESIKAYVDAVSFVSDLTGTANEITVSGSTGSVTVGLPDNVTIAGNLTVNGTTTTVATTQLVVEDNLIGLASSSAIATTDFGIYGQYNDGALKYSGFIRDASDSGTWKLLDGLTVEPTGMTYDATGQSLAPLDVGALSAAGIAAASLTLTTALALTDGGTGVTSFTDNGIVYGDGANALDVTAAGTEGQVLQAGSGGVPEFGTLDGGTF